jgi:hypothetical protein
MIFEASEEEEEAQRWSYDRISVISRPLFDKSDDRIVPHDTMSSEIGQNLAGRTHNASFEIKVLRWNEHFDLRHTCNKCNEGEWLQSGAVFSVSGWLQLDR